MIRLDAVSYRPGPVGGPGLRRYAGPWSLWGLAVSVVITGEFAGWNTGLLEGGFGGMLVATLLMSVMYVAISLSLAELSAAMPHSGAAYAFTRIAFGPTLGCAAGIAQVVEFTLAAAAVAVGLGGYVRTLALQAGLDLPNVVWWAVLYAVFIGLNVHGVVTLFRLAIGLAVVALLALVGFWVRAVPHFDLALALDILPAAGGSTWLPNGLVGIAWAVPFAVWFYLSIEAVALAAEETRDPARAIPRGFAWGIATLVAAALPTFILNSGVPPGATIIGQADEPLLVALAALQGDRPRPILLAIIGIAGQAASFHAMIYAYGRSIHALARAGYLPDALARLHPTRRTPHVALIAGGVLGFAVAVAGDLLPEALGLEALLIAMAVLAAVVSYILQMLAFLQLRRAQPDMARPYRSPFGATGAMTALVIALAAVVLMLFDSRLLPGFAGCAAVAGAGLAYYAFHARHRLRHSPEEDAALALGEGRKTRA
ncbi:amino acid ABC transporter permease [Allostella vacuolata]|nr:amino acid ABC transporter permease [Stella vacuolata]